MLFRSRENSPTIAYMLTLMQDQYKQGLHKFHDDKRKAIGEEVARLLAAKFSKEVFHPEWVANPVLVPKKTGELRMCIDFTGLNKHCPKDPFALPRIDQIIDSTAGSELLCFLDCFSGYHQIRLKIEDELKTSFITPFGAFCYKTMPFGLKNAGSTYQSCIQNCFKEQIGRNVHAYVDDVVIKSQKADSLIADLTETFNNLSTSPQRRIDLHHRIATPSLDIKFYMVKSS